jgi:hypothetical protein
MALPAQQTPALTAGDGYASDESEDLSDEHIQKLLKDAEMRLRQRADSRSSKSNYTLPRLDAGDLPRPYIDYNGKVAQLQPDRLPMSKMEEFVKRPRKIEDPVVVRRRNAEVCLYCVPSLRCLYSMRKHFPIISLTRNPGLVLSTALQHMIVYFIVTLIKHQFEKPSYSSTHQY